MTEKTTADFVKTAESLAEQNGWDGKLTGGIKGFSPEEVSKMKKERDSQ